MTTKLYALKDVQTNAIEYLDRTTGQVYADDQGLKKVRQLVETDFILGEKGKLVTDPTTGERIHVAQLSQAAATHMYGKAAELYGRSMPVKMRDEAGRLFTCDLAISDVHTNAANPGIALGYHIADGVADYASPVIMVPRASDVYYTANSDNDFKRKVPNIGSPGGAIPEVNPGYAPSTYQTVEYILGGFLPTEVVANADVPLKPYTKLMQMIVDGLRLEREIRVAAGLQTTGNWNSALVTTIAAGAQWNGGANSDPLANLHHAIEQSYLPVTGIVWSELVEHDFLRNPNIQKYFTFKDMIDGVPDTSKLSGTLRLPPIYTAKMKYVTSGALSYVWGNDVVLLHQPAEMPPTTQMEIATAGTLRWLGGEAPDGSLSAGLLVRAFFDPKRGGRGGTQIVACHNDAEQQFSGLVGGLLKAAHQ